MDEFTYARIKKEFDALRTLDLDVRENVDKVMDFFERNMPLLLKEINDLHHETERLRIKLGFRDMIE